MKHQKAINFIAKNFEKLTYLDLLDKLIFRFRIKEEKAKWLILWANEYIIQP